MNLLKQSLFIYVIQYMPLQNNTKNYNNYSLLKRTIGLTKPYRLGFYMTALLAVIIAPVTTARPYLIKVMVDDHVFAGDLIGLRNIALILIALLFLEALLRYTFIYTTAWLGQSVIRDLRVRVFDHLLALKLRFFDRTPIGTATTRTISDIETIKSVFSEGLITIVADILALIATLVVMFYTSWKLTLICLVTMPFLIIASYIFKEKVKAAFQKVRTKISQMNAFLQERITGMRVVQIFNAEEQEMNNFRRINKDYTKANLDSILYYAIFFPVVELIAAISLGLMVWWGAKDVLQAGGVTIGALIAFPVFLNMLFRPIRMIANQFNTLQMGLVASERVFKILDLDEKIEDKGNLLPQNIKGEITFKNVRFSYDDENEVLKGINFHVNAGETLAIIGSTGSGKSTIINLMNRFYTLNSGEIQVDGINIEDFQLKAYREKIAIVLQDVFLFSGSVLDNIRMRNDEISIEDVMKAAKAIGAHEFIMKLPRGYDYEVMERGAALSLGQRQLISFVRALVFDPKILILDEATSSIDPETEAVIQHAIETLIEKRTSIIVAHRLSTIRHANNIIVLSHGEILEYGSHDQLLESEDGHYRKLYEMQFLETSVDE